MKKNEIITNTNKAIIDSHNLDSALCKLGISAIYHEETEDGAIEVTALQKVDGEETEVTTYITDDVEKRSVHALDALLAIEKYGPAKKSVVFSYLYEVGTWKDNGFKKFSDYAKAINSDLNDGTIRKYLNIGLCFFQSGTDEPIHVDKRLKGVSVNNLDAIIAHFKAWANKKEVNGKPANYRDYVSDYLDDFYDPAHGVELLHLKKTQAELKEEVARLNGKDVDKKSDKKDKKSDNSEVLSPVDELLLAIANYSTDKEANAEVVALLDKVSELLGK